MSSSREDWEELRAHWQRLKRAQLSPDEVFDGPAQRRIGGSIAREAIRAPERVISLKQARRTEAYYLLQAADAQDHAQRAQAPTDRDAWLRLAYNWLALLRNKRASCERAPDEAAEGESTADSGSKPRH